MTKEEAKKEIEKVFEPAFANYIIKALTDGATESDVEPQEWISVKDRLPEKSDEYDVTLKDSSGERYVDRDYFYETQGCFKNGTFNKAFGYEIIAWKPVYVPSPYKGDEE